jgi:hypothetical protein
MIRALGYFIEIIRGSLITARHFIVNMFFHILKVLGIKTKRKGAVTIQYPEEKKELASRHRSNPEVSFPICDRSQPLLLLRLLRRSLS